MNHIFLVISFLLRQLGVEDTQSVEYTVYQPKQLAKQGLTEVGFDHRSVKYL